MYALIGLSYSKLVDDYRAIKQGYPPIITTLNSTN